MKKDIVVTFKAQPIGRDAVPSLIIKAEMTIPYLRGEPLATVGERYEAEGRKLEEALLHHLPGGVYDRLLAAMLRRKASYFVVPLEKPPIDG